MLPSAGFPIFVINHPEYVNANDDYYVSPLAAALVGRHFKIYYCNIVFGLVT
jgi:hypothetical protein